MLFLFHIERLHCRIRNALRSFAAQAGERAVKQIGS
jgi:hypothetical protein